MCDYSLHAVRTRKAAVGDKLVVATFRNTETKGLASPTDETTAVCLRPGAELAFDGSIVSLKHGFILGDRRIDHGTRVAKFVQLDTDKMHVHHDALQLIDGTTVLITSLVEGQTLSVLQLPADEVLSKAEPTVIIAEDPSEPAVHAEPAEVA